MDTAARIDILGSDAPDAPGAAALSTWIAPLFDAYRQFYRKPSDLPAAEEWLRRRIDGGEATVYIAAVPASDVASMKLDETPMTKERDGSHAAGFALLYPGFTSVSLATRWTLNDLFVDPAFRRLGVGRLLTMRAMLLVQTDGSAAAQLLTEHSNTSAQQLYKSLGWKQDAEYQRWTWKPPG